MAKRKQHAANADDSDDSSSQVSLVNVDFDFFDPNPAVDYHAIKRLLKQLFQRDAELFHLHELTELILSQPKVGTTIKTDGMESDPYALLTVLNMHVHQAHPSIKALAAYCVHQAASKPDLQAALQSLFAQSENHVGFVLCERLINMPVQVIPPMYNLLTEEIQWACEENEPFRFSHLIFISRTYHLTPADEEFFVANQTKKPSAKRSKAGPSSVPSTITRPDDGIYSFHPEDETIKQLAIHSLDYHFTSGAQEPRNKDSFGLDNRGRLMLLSIEKYPELVTKMNEIYGVH